MNYKDMAKMDQPINKLKQRGPSSLTETELISIVCGIDNVEDANNLVKEHSFAELYNCERSVLSKVLSDLKVSKLMAVLELSKRIARSRALARVQISSPGSIAAIYMEEMRYLKVEHLKLVMLDTKNNIISDEDISIGTVNASLINPREVLIKALKADAVHIIMLHNHPSTDCTPSREDIAITKRVAEAGDLIGIKLLDHLIIGDGDYVSLKERGIC